MIRVTFVVVVLLGVLPAAAQELGFLAIDEESGRSYPRSTDSRCGRIGRAPRGGQAR